MHNELINAKIPDNINLIINLDRRPNGTGTHFCAVSNMQDSDKCYYFDSFGVSPSDIIKKYMKSSGKKCCYNNSELQSFNSVLCGLYCLYFLENTSKGKDPLKILHKFKQNPSAFNEKMMDKYGHSLGL